MNATEKKPGWAVRTMRRFKGTLIQVAVVAGAVAVAAVRGNAALVGVEAAKGAVAGALLGVVLALGKGGGA